MRVAVVVQRYGADINGGAELHARYIAEHLARHVGVEVLTTCARDYITWANEHPPGESTSGGVTVRRFPVSAPRDPEAFGRWSARVFTTRHSVNDELAWLDAEGPASPDLVRFVTDHQADYDFLIFFSLRYYHTYHGARAVPGKAIIVPTAERDDVLGLGLFPPLLQSVRALMYNSPEERALLQAIAGTDQVPGVVVGVGSEIPDAPNPGRFRHRTGIRDRTAVYIGRIDENKGCVELFDYWERYAAMSPGGLTLVLIGQPIVPIPDHPRIRHLGFVNDEEKYDALAAAEFLVMPSYFESLSMVALEAWALGRPVLANGRCDVLRGQAVRSNAGLYYENFGEFIEAVRVLERNSQVAETLGRNGGAFFRSHYAWPVVERKYLDMFQRLKAEDSATAGRTMPPLPGWWGRRQRTLPAAREVLAALPAGPVVDVRHLPARPTRHTERVERTEPRAPGRHHEPRPVVRGAGKPAAISGGDASSGRGESGRASDRGARSGRFRRGRRPGPPRGRRGDG